MTYFNRMSFYDEATFHACGKVNGHNCHVWRSENPYDITEHECVSLAVNVWCVLMKNNVISPFFFEEPTATGDTFLAMSYPCRKNFLLSSDFSSRCL